jgi:hypothetical protein
MPDCMRRCARDTKKCRADLVNRKKNQMAGEIEAEKKKQESQAKREMCVYHQHTSEEHPQN